VLTAAMFRPGVKYRGVAAVIRSCGRLLREGLSLRLVVIGDGRKGPALAQLARDELGERAIFVGKVPRPQMYRYYSAGDLFAFPGIGESLGMVFLEAQSCGLPVVAVANAGVPEVVADGKTGCLAPRNEPGGFLRALAALLIDGDRRRKMGRSARAYIRRQHDLSKNYAGVDRVLHRIIENGRPAG
jgi:glycosyltransferase involved in cell wall biosynthesis